MYLLLANLYSRLQHDSRPLRNTVDYFEDRLSYYDHSLLVLKPNHDHLLHLHSVLFHILHHHHILFYMLTPPNFNFSYSFMLLLLLFPR